MWTNEIKTKTSHIKLTLRPVVWFRPQTMHWYHNGFTNWRQSLKEDFLSIMINVWLSMMSGHSANLVFCNNNKKDWTSKTLANPHPSLSSNILFLPYLPPPSKWTSYPVGKYWLPERPNDVSFQRLQDVP